MASYYHNQAECQVCRKWGYCATPKSTVAPSNGALSGYGAVRASG